MPMYLVRWPDLSAALVKAASEDELLVLLDEVANSDGCTWRVYKGPLFLEFALPVGFEVKDHDERTGPIRREDIVVNDVSGLQEGAPLEITFAQGDTGGETSRAIEKLAFPRVFQVRHDHDEEPGEAELREAVAAELATLVRTSWRWEQVSRRDDLESRIAVDLGASPALVRRLAEEAKQRSDPDLR